MLLDFPYSTDDEPTDRWTIEQVMHWWLLRAHEESDAQFDDIVGRLSKQLEEGKASLWDDHKHVKAIVSGDEPTSENADPQIQQKLQPEKRTVKTEANDTIIVEIIAGEYQGTTYNLQPKGRAYSWVGRSTAKKFKDKGISLPKDLEVSTTHGRFEFFRSKFVYVDTGSTNGSKVGGVDLEPNEAIQLDTGMEITIGQTVMKVTVPY